MDENAFDATIVGTGLTESILAAALSKVGLRVLHIDTDANYGSADASLTLIDLHHMLLSPPYGLADISIPVPISEALLHESRHYAISLAPSVVSSIGPLIDTLVKSGVSRYVKFKLLDGVGLYAGNEGGSVKTVPGSKEDVFKSKELGLLQKRKLMKFMMAIAAKTESRVESKVDEVAFLDHLTSKEIGLEPEVANAVAYALSLSSDPKEPTSEAIQRLQKYIRSTGRHGNSPFLIGHFGGAGEIAQGFCRSAAVAGATYILGRKFTIETQPPHLPASASNPSASASHPFSLSFDGIADTLTSQFIISRHSAMASESTSRPALRKLARCVAILEGPVYFSRPPLNEDASLQDPVEFDEEDENATKGEVDSAILVFPPGSLTPSGTSNLSAGDPGVVSAFISGPNALACPDGKRIIYLSTEIASGTSPEDTLQPYLNAIQTLNRPNNEQSPVLMSLFYSQDIPLPQRTDGVSKHASESTSSTQSMTTSAQANAFVMLNPSTLHLAEFSDEAAVEAERVFWGVMQRLGLDGRDAGVDEGQSTGDVNEDVQLEDDAMEKVLVMWPRLCEESGDDGW